MAGSSVSKQHTGDMRITAEEKELLSTYRQLARWDRTFLCLILQSLVYGRFTPKADELPFDEIVRSSALPKSMKAAVRKVRVAA